MSKLFWGTVLIVGGVLLLLLQVTPVFPAGLPFWPAVAVIFGVYLCFRAFLRDPYPLRRRFSWVMLSLGALIATWGLFDILHFNGHALLSGREAIGRSWPVILVALGLGLILGKSEDDWDDGPKGGGGGRWGWHRDPPAVLRYMSRVGDVHIGRKPWRLGGAFDLRHSIGDVRVDLTTADITPGDHHIRINSSIGEVVVLVPSNCSARVAAFTAIGSVQVFDESRDGLPAALKESIDVPGSDVTLYIRVRTRIGSVSVRRVPAARSASGNGRAAEAGHAAGEAPPTGEVSSSDERRAAGESGASEGEERPREE